MGSLISPSHTTMSCLYIVLILVLAASSNSRSLPSTLPTTEQPKTPHTALSTIPSPPLEATPWYPAHDMEATPFGPMKMEENSNDNVHERRGLEDLILEIR